MNVINHPIALHQLTIMRDKKSNATLFRSCLESLSYFLAYETTRDLGTRPVEIETPLAKMEAFKTKEKVVLVPILRAGLGMVDSFRKMIPPARIGHIGIYRNEETAKPVEYYSKLPTTTKGSVVIVLDPMLATGSSVIKAIDIIKTYQPKKIKFACVVAAPEGIEALEKAHPDVECYTVSIDKKLNKDKYIVPGLGDAGDRIFGTK